MPATLYIAPPGYPLGDLLLPRLEEALREGRSVWYLVPDTRARSARVRSLARRGAVLDPPIGTLRDLALRALREAGEYAPARPDPLVSNLMAREALRRVLPEIPEGPGLPRAAQATISALRADGWTPATLGDTLDRVGEATESHVLALWSAMEEICPEDDTQRPMRRVLEGGLLTHVAPELLVIEGGPLAGELAARLLQALVGATRARGGTICAACADLPQGRGRHARGALFLQQLLGVQGESVQLDGTDRASGPIRLAHQLFRDGPTQDTAVADDVIRLHAPDADTTADLVAREIRGLLAAAPSPAAALAGGISIVCPTTADRKRVEHALERLAVPIARARQGLLGDQPGGRFLLALLRVLEGGRHAPADAVLALLSSDGWGYTSEAQDRLTRLARVKGAVSGGDILGLLPMGRSRLRLERLFALADEFASERTAEGFARIARKAVGNERARDLPDPLRAAWRRHGVEHALLFNGPLQRFNGLLEALADYARRTGMEFTPAAWLRELRTMIEGTEMQAGTAPPRGVRLERPGRLEPADVVFVVGLVERVFPRAPRRDPFLPESLHATLAVDTLLGGRGWGDTADEQREAFLLGCAAARRTLYLCHPRADAEGREVLPSFFIEDAARTLGLKSVDHLPAVARRRADTVHPPERVCTPAELRAALAAALRDPDLPDPLRADVRRAWDATGIRVDHVPSHRVAELGAEEKDMLAKRAERISASQLAAYGHCQFKHFVTTHLKPETLELPVFDALQRGSVVHDWLWELGMTPGGWANPGPVLDRLFAVGPADTPPSVFASGRSRAEWEHWATRVREWATEEAERIAARPFQPTYNELAFGRGDRDRVDPASRPDPITLEFDGRAIAFAGSIDRVDCWTDDRGTRWGLALDYKTGSVDEYTAKLSTGDELQLPLYLRVLEALGIKPAGALYLSIKDGGIAGIVRAEFAPRLGDLGQRVIVATEEEWAELRAIADRAVLAHHDGMRNGQLRVWPRDGKCEFCTLQALCRIDLWKARREEARG